MPVAHFHLIDGAFTDAQRHRLLTEASRCYAEILASPLDRTRVFIVGYKPADVAVGGLIDPETSNTAPYFTAIVLAGRSVEQRQQLAARFTDLLETIMGVPRAAIRGRIIEVEPENWSIGGRSAAEQRAEEIAARR
ncbi:tautomerase family protein [Mycolicibacterium helvum]|uniref:4-oxalocrotonate tautomerase-like domain-containing protein n=1 Tax=Mycolicibacterium helvum TaxID=1534349 RepID=A0A7I7SY20_9MYCO|nr:tautomerase family protein [Mycolicibacterium helvum]BBY61917.1 hypothetical protein MHEL_01600 [Mycolicibacterium helvum]